MTTPEPPTRPLRRSIALIVALAIALLAGPAEAGKGSRGKKSRGARKPPAHHVRPSIADHRQGGPSLAPGAHASPSSPAGEAPAEAPATGSSGAGRDPGASSSGASSSSDTPRRPRFYTPLWPGAGGTDPKDFDSGSSGSTSGRGLLEEGERETSSRSSRRPGFDDTSSSKSARGSSWLSSKPAGPPPKPRAERLPGKVIRKSDDFPIAEHPVRVAVLGRGDLEAVPRGLVTRMRNFARMVGERKHPLVTGGGNGLPREAEQAAFDAGGTTWAVSAVKDVDDQLRAHDDVHRTSILYTTGTGKGAGTIEREAPLVQVANVRTYWNGGPGTFGELIAGLHEPGVLAFATGSGGVAGAALSEILPHISPPKHVRVVSSHDPRRLLDMSERALEQLAADGVDVTPKALFSPSKQEDVLRWSQRMDHTVMAFLTDDGGAASPADRARTMHLVDKAVVREHKGKDAIVTVPQSASGMRVAARSARHGVVPFLVSYEKGQSGYVVVRNEDGSEAPARIQVKFQGQGAGVGQFASHRGVVEDADVVYVTSANFKNLSGLAFALRRSKPIIAVLEMDSTRSDKLRRILEVVQGGELGERFVFDSDPGRLVDKVHAALIERDKPKPILSGKDKDRKGATSSSSAPTRSDERAPHRKDKGDDDVVEVD